MNIKDIVTGFLRWIAAAFSSSDVVSIKRICGAAVVFALIIILFLVARKHIEISVWDKIEPFCKYFLNFAGFCFGINAALDVAKMVRGPGDPSNGGG